MLLERCEELCKQWMAGQLRHTAPDSPPREAWKHPEDVVNLLDEWSMPSSWNPALLPHLKAVAWLHDVPEDGKHEDGRPVTDSDLLAEGIPHLIVTDVMHVTQRPGEDRVAFLQRVAAASFSAKILKSADRTCNLREGRLTFKPPRWARYVKETELYILPFADRTVPWFAGEMRKAMALRPVEQEA